MTAARLLHRPASWQMCHTRPVLWLLLPLLLTGPGLPMAAAQDNAAAAPAAPAEPSAATGGTATAADSPGAAAATGTTAQSADAGAASAAATGSRAPSPLPLSQRPYRVRVELGLMTPPDGPQTSVSRLIHDISAALLRMYGPMWSTTVVESDWLVPASSSMLHRVDPAILAGRYTVADVEKAMLVCVEFAAGGWTVSCREFDTRVQELTPVLQASTLDEREIPALTARLLRDSFRPVLMLAEPAQGSDELEFELQAGELPPADASAAQIATGDILRPFLRHMERRTPGKLRQLQRLDLTYIRVTEFNRELTPEGLTAEDSQITVPDAAAGDTAVYQDRGHVRGVLISHGLVPFGGRGRNVEQLALRQRPQTASSRVQLVLSLRPDRPLVCHRVDKVAKLRWQDDSSQPTERLVSGRNGEIEIAVDPQNPTFWLYVYSGSLLLARVPYAPGLLEADTIRLPDDSIRLGVEGELYLFRDQLVDMVARRAVFKGIAKQAAAAGDTAKLENAISSLDALPGKKEFDAQLNAIRVPAVDRAKQLKNRSAERTVEKLCAAMAKSLDEFFQTEKQIRELEEIQRLRAIAEQKAAAGAGAQ